MEIILDQLEAHFLIRVLATSSAEFAWQLSANPASNVGLEVTRESLPRLVRRLAELSRQLVGEDVANDKRQIRRKPRASVESPQPRMIVSLQRCHDVKECSLRVGSIACQLHDDRPQRRRDVFEKSAGRASLAGEDGIDERALEVAA